MSRTEAIQALETALKNDDYARFIAVLEDYRASTAIVLYLLVEKVNPQKARQWLVKRVGGKTANKLVPA